MLRGEDLTLTYPDGDTAVHAVRDVSILIPDHQFIGILGPSGSGKSSLLYLLSGLRKQTRGEVYLDDRAYGKMADEERVALRDRPSTHALQSVRSPLGDVEVWQVHQQPIGLDEGAGLELFEVRCDLVSSVS